jgi:predicted transcriptional regulator
MPNLVNTSIKMPQFLRDRVQKLAAIRRHSAHALMLHAIESYVDREEQREELRQAGVRAHDEYMRTGLHLTNAEVKAWLAELARGNAMEPPECHTQ